VHFDFNDTKNAKSKLFISDLNGEHIGSAICPERVIPDPCKGNSGCGPGAAVAPDGMVRGLRSCKEGDWFDQRDRDALFVLEHFGFYDAMQPTVAAFVGKNREDLFVELSVIMSRHYANADASASECEVAPGKSCVRDNLVSYEPLLSNVFAQDVLPAVVALSKELNSMLVKRCTATDPTTKACTKTETVTGTQVLAAATRSLLSPDLAKTSGLKNRRGDVTGLRNDGSKTPQVTPIYLITNALSAVDKTFADYDVAHPEEKGERLVRWRRARSQLVDRRGELGARAGLELGEVEDLAHSRYYVRGSTPKRSRSAGTGWSITSQKSWRCEKSTAVPRPRSSASSTRSGSKSTRAPITDSPGATLKPAVDCNSTRNSALNGSSWRMPAVKARVCSSPSKLVS
jgi:hypothetical protein